MDLFGIFIKVFFVILFISSFAVSQYDSEEYEYEDSGEVENYADTRRGYPTVPIYCRRDEVPCVELQGILIRQQTY
ncbi:hypothetical protein Ocin01_18333 [Orchesella cincta]|uniref:Uncharacterized protein n=1 Tax=Orchesella cincta TaxID=48709 RepID=A0A1D2M5U8_ORCCI|nr:hypothetical protein Ocin01_18333 [Orchesella cincta]